MKIKITLLLFLICFFGYSQVTNQGKPVSWKLSEDTAIQPILMPEFNLEQLQREDAVNDAKKDKPWRFGYEFLVDYNLNNSGNWTTLANGDRIWRIRFLSNGAKTLNFLLSDFYMPEGATLYLYNNDRTDLLGAYDASQNNDERTLGTWLVQGQDIWLEYFEPKVQQGRGKLEVFKVVHGYRTQNDLTKAAEDEINYSGKCNYDVNCTMGAIDNLKDINKKSVALIVVGGSSFCTGALVNNTSNNGTPYFLTANHCYDSSVSQWAFRFNWISPTPACAEYANSGTNTNYYQTVSGAMLRARRAQSDFCLLQITAPLPASWDLVWAGWDRSEVAPASTFGIHHPSGDIMKVCVDNQSPVLSNAGGENVWRIQNWDLGVTEGGSSGSPLFNSAGRIIGQLYGGTAACNGTSASGYDEYGRFGASWNNGPAASSRLRDWLDPTGTNAVTLDYYPQQNYTVNAKLDVMGIKSEFCGDVLTPVIKIKNNGTQNLTSAQISYYLNSNTPTVINWTGNLSQGQSDDLTIGGINVSPGNYTFNVSVTNPNGVADQLPADNSYQAGFTVLSVYQTTQVNLQLRTDAYGSETRWQVRDSNNTVISSGGPYTSSTTINQIIELNEGGCYTFVITDDEGDGICCFYGNGYYRLTLPNGTILKQGGSFGAAEVVAFRTMPTMSSDEFSLTNNITVYPNPSNGIFNLSVKQIDSELNYQVYNMLGQSVKSGKVNGNGNYQVDLNGFANGIYILKINDAANQSVNFKIVKE